MFSFLREWSETLYSFERDIERCLMGEVQSWVTHSQVFCETLMKMYNAKAEHYKPGVKLLTLGYFLNDVEFCEEFTDKTGFCDYEKLKQINQKSNAIKHKGVPQNENVDELNNLLKSMYDLSVAVYNYVNGCEYVGTYDYDYFPSLIEKKDREFDSTIAYADKIIQEKNAIIVELSDALEVMHGFAKEDSAEKQNLKEQLSQTERNSEIQEILISQLEIAARKAFMDNKGEFVALDYLVGILDFIDKKPENMSWSEYSQQIKASKDASEIFRASGAGRSQTSPSRGMSGTDCMEPNEDDYDASFYEGEWSGDGEE